MNAQATDIPKPRGWARPLNSRKFHYFIDRRSLCSRWLFMSDDLEDAHDYHGDNCAACRKEVLKLRATESAA